jgi:hypothetical protein
MNKLLKGFVYVIFGVFGIVYVMDKLGGSAPDAPKASSTPNAPATVAAPPAAKSLPASRPRPEDVVVFESGGIACFTQEALRKITEHSLRGESTKANAMLLAGDRPQCLMLDPTRRAKVLSVYFGDPTLDIGLLELIGEGSKSSTGMWAYSVGAKVVARAQ